MRRGGFDCTLAFLPPSPPLCPCPRFLVGRTQHTLLLGDLDTCKLSEVEWHSDGSEKFIFDNESVCIVYYQGELTIIMYGRNAVSRQGPCRAAA